MAIIKCPECGHPVSDKAPVCPSCGVQIANKVIQCEQCGEVYFKADGTCPVCHHAAETSSSQQHRAPVVNSLQSNYNPSQPAPQPKKSMAWVYVLIACLVLLFAGGGYYFYNQHKGTQETQAYQTAMESNDVYTLQNYLDTYPDAPLEHKEKVDALLKKIKQEDMDWTNALVSGSKANIQDFLDRYPETRHKVEAMQKMDSIDWNLALSENTLDAYNQYKMNHVNGLYFDEADKKIKEISAKTITYEEKQEIKELFSTFFDSIHRKDENSLVNTVSDYLSSFLGKTGATSVDVLSFMRKLYKEDIINMNWRLLNDFKIDKKEIGDEEYEYTVHFSVQQDVEKNSTLSAQPITYKIVAKVGPDYKISEFNMVKILQQ